MALFLTIAFLLACMGLGLALAGIGASEDDTEDCALSDAPSRPRDAYGQTHRAGNPASVDGQRAS